MITFDQATVDSSGAFLIGELERLDQTLNLPLVGYTWTRDIQLREDVSIADDISSWTNTSFGAAGTGANPNGKNWVGKDSTAIAGVNVDIGKDGNPLNLWGMELGWTVVELAAAQQTIADNAHKNDFFDNYAYCGGSLGFREVAKLLKAKEHEFRSFLCAKRYMYQLSGQWMAYAQHLDAGRFEVKTGTAERNNYAFAKTVFTPKGVQWIAGEWGKHQAEKELNCQVPALQETPYTYAQH